MTPLEEKEQMQKIFVRRHGLKSSTLAVVIECLKELENIKKGRKNGPKNER